jgi:predicted phage terminase large subunit-like protein
MDARQAAFLLWQRDWAATARSAQIPDLVAPDGFVECGYMAGRGFGKALTLDTSIPTPRGWTTMGELRDGDEVFDEQGRMCRVIAAHEPYEPAILYRVRFSDGSEIEADGMHLWVTWTALDRKRWNRKDASGVFPHDWASDLRKIRTTDQIARTMKHGARGDRNHCIPLAGILKTPEALLPVDPWVLGYWLGNGAQRDALISCHDDDAPGAFDRFQRAGYRITPRAIPREGYALNLVPVLRGMGLINNKHIPATYLRASKVQRVALLAGLLDSDGHCHAKTGHIEFCSTDLPLAQGVMELARSLAQKPVFSEGRSMLRGVDHGPKYRVTWRPTFNPFSLPRKAAAYREPGAQALRNQHRMIVAVEQVPARTVRCITVNSANAMYLAGEAMIPTHNTRVGSEWLARQVYLDADGYDSAVIAPTYQDVKFVCFEGESGLLSVIPPELIKAYNKSDLVIEMHNVAGGVTSIRGFTAEKPERLRGPQNARLWCDELAAWQYDDVWDMAMMGLRLGQKPQVLWTTTPKPRDLVRRLTAPKPGRVIVTGSTYDNRANLPEVFFDQLSQYEGTTIGRQELYGELINPEESGIVKRSHFRLWPHDKPLPRFELVVMSLDTAFTEATTDKRSGDADPTACTVWGVFQHEKRANVMLLDCWDEHLGLPDLLRRVRKEMNVSYGDDDDEALIKPLFGSSKPVTSGRKPDILLIEDKGSGISLRQMLERERIEAYAYNPGRADKLTRLHIVSPIFARKMVWLPESVKHPGRPRNWVDAMLNQLCSYTGPGSVKHDDYVDSTSQAFRLMMDKRLLDSVQAKKDEPSGPPPKPVSNPYAS